MPLTKQAKKIQDMLLSNLGEADDSIYDSTGQALTLVSDVSPKQETPILRSHEGEQETPILRFRDRDVKIGDRTRFMNALATLLANFEVQKLDSFSAILEAITDIVNEIDLEVGASLNEIYHDNNFQELEANWRSLDDLARSVSEEDVIIDFLDVSKEELRADLADHKTDTFGIDLFRKVYIDEYDSYGGKPFAAMIGLYEFDCSEEDIKWLDTMGEVSNAAHCPFISSVGPEFFPPCKTMEDVAEISDLDAVLAHPRYSKWRELRDTDGAAYIGLTLPRYILRQPWGVRENEYGNRIGYKEVVFPQLSGESDDFLWGNSAILMAKNMVRSYENSGWAQHIRGPKNGGLVGGLTSYSYFKNGHEEIKPPIEIAIPDYRELQFSRNGFIPLVHKKNEALATFFSTQSIKKPKYFLEDINTKNSHLVTNLAYTLSITRLAHFVKRMMREYIGSTANAGYIQLVLTEWLNSYVTTVTNPDDLTLRYYPFKATSVKVEPKPGPFGWYKATIAVLPHVQFEGMDVELQLEAALGGEA